MDTHFLRIWLLHGGGDNVSEEHVELIWTEGQHIRGDRDDELRQLLDIVLSRVAASH